MPDIYGVGAMRMRLYDGTNSADILDFVEEYLGKGMEVHSAVIASEEDGLLTIDATVSIFNENGQWVQQVWVAEGEWLSESMGRMLQTTLDESWIVKEVPAP